MSVSLSEIREISCNVILFHDIQVSTACSSLSSLRQLWVKGEWQRLDYKCGCMCIHRVYTSSSGFLITGLIYCLPQFPSFKNLVKQDFFIGFYCSL